MSMLDIILSVFLIVAICLGITGVKSLEIYFKKGNHYELFFGVAFCLLANGMVTLSAIMLIDHLSK